MCEAGRIRHHLKHNLWKRESAIVFTGFQALGTLGRTLIDGAANVTLFSEEIAVNCRIYSFKGMSAHADMDCLHKWIDAFESRPERVFVVHGENDVSLSFADRLVGEGYRAVAPKFSSIYYLLTGETIFEGRELIKRSEPDYAKRESPVYQRLMLAGTRLLEVITRNKGGANKELAKFADQIDALSTKWNR
jgi:metallo-beta-lactamase family protein